MPEGQSVDVWRPVAYLGLEVAALRGQRGGIRVEVDEDEAAECLDLHLVEADVAGVEPLERLGMRRARQAAVQPIGPGVVGTHDPADGPFARQQRVGAVLADVVEGAQRAVAVAHDGNRMPGHLDGEVGTRRAQFLDMANPLPAARNDAFQVDAEPPRVDIGFLAQRERPRRMAVETLADCGKVGGSRQFRHPQLHPGNCPSVQARFR